MEFALYRYEFEVMEKKDSSASLFPDHHDNLTPRLAFERKSELLNELLLKDYQMLDTKQSENNSSTTGMAAEMCHKIYDIQKESECYYRMPPTELHRMLSSERYKRIYEKSIAKRNETTHEQRGEKSILTFENGSYNPIFHKYITAPQDGFAILQLGRLPSASSRLRLSQKNAEKNNEYNKPIHIIIDNRGTHQRVAIEVKAKALSTDAVAAMLANTLCKAFASYGLMVKVVPIRDDKYFWNIVSN